MITEFLDIQIYKTIHTFSILLKQLFSAQSFSLKILFIFCAGIVNSLNPCSLGILPVVAYSLQESDQLGQLFRWIIFTLGVFTAFLCFFVIRQSISEYFIVFLPYQSIWNIVLFLCLGFFLLGFMPNISLISSLDHILGELEGKPKLISYFTGLSLGLTVSSCTTPILFTVLVWLSNQKGTIQQILYGLSYSLGYTCPWLITIAISKQFIQIFSNVSWVSSISSIFGIYFLGIGTYQTLLYF